MTREEKRQLLFDEFKSLADEIFPAKDNDCDYFLAVFDHKDNTISCTCTTCPRCALSGIELSLDEANIQHDGEESNEKVH